MMTNSLTIKQTIQQLKKGIISAEELCKRCQDAIVKTRNLNIYIEETATNVLKDNARVSTSLYAKGMHRSLEGIPISFKDNFCTQGTGTSCGSKMLANYRPPYNSTMVSRVQESGGIVIGKTNLDEFAMGSGSIDSSYGPVINPWNLSADVELPQKPSNTKELNLETGDWYICGGSSGGSAAAVASGSCLAAFGSDTGGSTRNPASYCGVVGLKPTYGLLSRHGLIPLVNSMDVPGVMARTVEDVALVTNAVSGHDTMDSTTVAECHSPISIQENMDLSQLHIGIPKEYSSTEMSAEVASLWQDTADKLAQAGAQVSQVSLPHTRLCINCYHVLCCCEVASNMARYDGIQFGLRDGSEESTEQLYADSRGKGFNDVVRSRILAGNFFLLKRNYDKYFIKALKVRRLISDDFKTVFNSGVNVLLTPVTLTDAPLFSWFSNQDNRTRCEEQDIFTTPVNMAGVPAVSLPLRLSSRGLPLSLQLIGQPFKESTLLSVAAWLEREANFPYLNLEQVTSECRLQT